MHVTAFLTQRAESDLRWQQLKNAHIFMTGGSGLFGTWWLAALVDANRRLDLNIQVSVLSRNAQALAARFTASPEVHILQGDVTQFAFPATRFSHVIHMATTSAQETFAGEDSLAKYHMLTLGTERVLQLAAHSGAQRVLFTSSGVAYGAQPEGLVSEDSLGAPNTLDAGSGLGQGKRAAEFLCSYYAQKYQFESVIARCFAFAGAGLPLNIHYALGNFVHDALYASDITVKGDGSPMRSFLYLGDLVHWLLALLVQGKTATVVNVGSDQAISVRDLAHKVRDLIAPHKSVVILGDCDYNVGNFTRNWYVPDISKARQTLALDVWTTLDHAILSMLP